MDDKTKDPNEEFEENLKKGPSPVNDTVSPQMQEYLNNLNDGTLIRESAEKNKKESVEEFFCPMCRRATLKKARFGWKCSQCSFETNTPLKVSREQ